MRKIVFGLLAVFAFCTASVAQDKPLTRSLFGFWQVASQNQILAGEHCQNIPVLVITKVTRVSRGAMAIAANSDMGRHTEVNDAAFRNPPLLRFQMAHECVHHRKHIHDGMLDWVKNPATLSPGERLNQMSRLHQEELEADCDAAKELFQRGDLEALQAALVDFQSTRVPASQSHPSSEARMFNIRSCAR